MYCLLRYRNIVKTNSKHRMEQLHSIKLLREYKVCKKELLQPRVKTEVMRKCKEEWVNQEQVIILVGK